MTLRADTERRHDILGPMRFDNGREDAAHSGHARGPGWVARPDGWENAGFEILLSGGSTGPDSKSLDRAVRAFMLRAQIEAEGQVLIRPKINGGRPTGDRTEPVELDLLWIDCTSDDAAAFFHSEGDTYVLWRAPLDLRGHVIAVERGHW